MILFVLKNYSRPVVWDKSAVILISDRRDFQQADWLRVFDAVVGNVVRDVVCAAQLIILGQVFFGVCRSYVPEAVVCLFLIMDVDQHVVRQIVKGCRDEHAVKRLVEFYVFL